MKSVGCSLPAATRSNPLSKTINARVRVQVGKALDKGPLPELQVRRVEDSGITGLRIGSMAPDSRFIQKFKKYEYVGEMQMRGQTCYLYVDTTDNGIETDEAGHTQAGNAA